MIITLLRHGQAEPFASASRSDSGRQLTQHGEETSRAAADTLSAFSQRYNVGGVQAGRAWRVYHSPFDRTTQTANLFADRLKQHDAMRVGCVDPSTALLGDNTPAACSQWLESRVSSGTTDYLVLVTHQPLVSLLCAWLVDGGTAAPLVSSYPFYPSSLAVLECEMIGQGCARLLSLDHH